MFGAWKDQVRRLAPEGLLRAIRFARANDPLLNLAERLALGRTAVDVGANEGLYTHRFARSAARVVAFEPILWRAESLKTRYHHVQIEACALSDHDGDMTLFVPVKEGRVIDTRASLEAEANPGYSLVAQPTPVRRLDAWRLDDVAVIKIDVEGHEAAVLAGARETILRNRPALVVEIEERHHPGRSSSIVDDLVANGYRAHYIEGGEVVGADVIDFVRLQPPALAKSPDGAFDSGYVNNFLFLPREGRTQVL